jgi:hypothetical protein
MKDELAQQEITRQEEELQQAREEVDALQESY